MNEHNENPGLIEAATPQLSDMDRLNVVLEKIKQPEFQEREVFVGRKVIDGKVTEPGISIGFFTFRRLPYAEVDRLRLMSTGKDGNFDPEAYAGNNGRWVIASLVDKVTHVPLLTSIDVDRMDTRMVDALADAATDVNAVNKGAPELLKGN